MVRIALIVQCLVAALALLAGSAGVAAAAEPVHISGLTWPGYGFWFIAKEKGLAPDLDLSYQRIEDPNQSFNLADRRPGRRRLLDHRVHPDRRRERDAAQAGRLRQSLLWHRQDHRRTQDRFRRRPQRQGRRRSRRRPRSDLHGHVAGKKRRRFQSGHLQEFLWPTMPWAP